MAAARICTDFIDELLYLKSSQMRRNMKTGVKLFLRNFFDRFFKTSYRQDLQAIVKFLKVTGCYYCCCYCAELCDLNRKIVQFF